MDLCREAAVLEGTKEQKNILLNSVASNLFLKDKKVTFSLKKPFDMLANGQKRPIQLTTPPLTLYQIFNRETIAKVRIQLEVAKKIASNPLAYQVVEV